MPSCPPRRRTHLRRRIREGKGDGYRWPADQAKVSVCPTSRGFCTAMALTATTRSISRVAGKTFCLIPHLFRRTRRHRARRSRSASRFSRSSDPDERWRGAWNAQPGLANAFLDSELARWNLPANALALVGFSQGAVMALHVALRRRVMPAAVVGYSGMLLPNDGPPEQVAHDVIARPPFLLVHGDSDPMIPVETLFRSAERLAALHVPVEWHILSGIGHSIDARSACRR